MSVKLCKGKTKANQPCKKHVKDDYCHHHISQKNAIPIKISKKKPLKYGLISEEQQEITNLKREAYKLLVENESLKGKINKITNKNINQKSELSKFSEINRKKNEKIQRYKDENKELKLEKEKSIREADNLKNFIERQQQKISELTAKNKSLNKVADKYGIIVEFEKMKAEIKKIFNWDKKEFYIEIVRKQTKYHYILEKTFNMSIKEIIEEYWRLRRLRLNYAHPFGY